MSLQKMVLAKLAEAEDLVAAIKMLPRESEEGAYAIHRWAAVGDDSV